MEPRSGDHIFYLFSFLGKVLSFQRIDFATTRGPEKCIPSFSSIFSICFLGFINLIVNIEK